MSKINEFLKFEKDNNLFDYQHKGVHFWALIRFGVYEYFFLETKNAHPDSKNERFFNRFNFIKFIPEQIAKKSFIKKGDLFVSDNNIYKMIDNKRIDPYIDFFKYGTFEAHNHTVFSAMLSNDIIYSGTNDSWIIFKEYVYCLFNKVLRKLKLIKIPKEIVKFLDILKQKNINVPMNYEHHILRSIFCFKLRKKFHMNLVKNKFKCIVLVDHYNVNHMSLCLAARELNIPSIELQHGIITCQHIAYNFFDVAMENKYLPQYIFTFGNYFNDSMRLPNGTTSISVGYPQMDFSLCKHKGIVQDEKQIIFYSQGTIGDKLSILAINLAKLALCKNYVIKYKLHPSECKTWKREYPHLVNEKIIEVLDQPMNVHELLASAKFHIGVNSTVLIEALAFNGTVFVYNTSHDEIEYMADFIKEGYMHSFEDENELLDLLANGPKNGDIDISKNLFKSNAIKNIDHEVKEIISRS